MVTSRTEAQRVNDEVSDLAEEAKQLFRFPEHYRATVLLRATHLRDGDVVVSDDEQEKVAAIVRDRWPVGR